jgi:excisionase family DNA binding protein
MDTSKWLTKQQAADVIGVSTKTVEQLARPRKSQPALIQQAERRRPGKPSIVVYHPDDVERVRAERNPDAAPFVMPPAPPDEAAQTEVVLASQNFQTPLEVLLRSMQRPASPRLFMTVEEAADYSGLPRGYLRGLIKEGKLGMKTGSGWRIRRADLETL